MNGRTSVGVVSLAVAGALLLSVNAGWLELPGANPDPEWVNLEGVGDIGMMLGDTTLVRAWMSDGSLAIDGGDSNEFDLVLLRQEPWATGYEFFVRSNVGQVDTFQVMAGEELTLAVPDSVGPDVPVQWTISGQESGWPWESGDLVVELAPCAGGVQCRVEQRSVGDVPPYLVVTDREGVGGQSWDVLNEADESLTIVVPSDEVFSFRFRALDPRFGLWRGVSPLVNVVTRVCETPPPPTSSGPQYFRAWFVNSWTMRVAFEDSLFSESSSIDPATVSVEDIYIEYEGTDQSPSSMSDLTWGWYYYFGRSQMVGSWKAWVPAGAVADTFGVANSDTLRWEWVE